MLYLALLEGARYLQIIRLQDWFENRRYLSALTVGVSVVELDPVVDNTFIGETGDSVSADSTYWAGWETRSIYVCPRGIPVHREEPGDCGWKRKKAQARTVYNCDKELVARVLQVRTETELDTRVCLVHPRGT